MPVASHWSAHPHEVGELGDSIGRQEARDQDVGVREVHLLVGHPVVDRGELEAPAALVVEQSGEDARRVEVRVAHPVDRSVRPTSATVCKSPITPWCSMGR
jgi:hypothetical protein